MGFKYIEFDTVPSANQGQVPEVKVNGHPIPSDFKV